VSFEFFICFDFVRAGGIESDVIAFAVSAFGWGRWATGWSGSEVTLFWATWVFAAMLGSGVSSGADGVCGYFV
jgi:TRAP-type C4-dicarboxylate transport system permease large subunit